MSQNSCPTMQIQVEATAGNPDGVLIITVGDFDSETMTPVDPEEVVAPVAPVAPWQK
jgi:hypothetical protein